MTQTLPNLILLKGLPGSGKTTWALQYLASHPGSKRINKDDLRNMLDLGRGWSGPREAFITQARDALVLAALESEHDVIVDDTNLNLVHEFRLRDITQGLCTFEVKFIDTDIETCISNDLKRARSVGERVIRGMWRDYLEPAYSAPTHDPELPDAYIFDIDGTLAHKGSRDAFDYAKVGLDTVDTAVRDILDLVECRGSGDTGIIIVSGREGTPACLEATKAWLLKAGITYDHLHLRSAGDFRSDDIVKQEIYEQHIKGKFNVLGVFDDRDKVVAMWRRQGLKCFQVQPGAF